jgi:hypothetical protein
MKDKLYHFEWLFGANVTIGTVNAPNEHVAKMRVRKAFAGRPFAHQAFVNIKEPDNKTFVQILYEVTH